MSRQQLIDGCRATWIAARQHITKRRVARAFVVVGALSFVAVVCEAVVRGRIHSPRDRLPTALYTRTVPWGSDERRTVPVAFGSVDGAPMEQRLPVRLDELPKHLTDAVLAVEDQRFYAHHGLDMRRIGGAIIANARALAIAEGGSTITQQLAKNLFLTADRTPVRNPSKSGVDAEVKIEAAGPVVRGLRFTGAVVGIARDLVVGGHGHAEAVLADEATEGMAGERCLLFRNLRRVRRTTHDTSP